MITNPKLVELQEMRRGVYKYVEDEVAKGNLISEPIIRYLEENFPGKETEILLEKSKKKNALSYEEEDSYKNVYNLLNDVRLKY